MLFPLPSASESLRSDSNGPRVWRSSLCALGDLFGVFVRLSVVVVSGVAVGHVVEI